MTAATINNVLIGRIKELKLANDSVLKELASTRRSEEALQAQLDAHTSKNVTTMMDTLESICGDEDPADIEALIERAVAAEAREAALRGALDSEREACALIAHAEVSDVPIVAPGTNAAWDECARTIEAAIRARAFLAPAPQGEEGEDDGLIRDLAVGLVDIKHGYTCEFSSCPKQHEDEYDLATEHLKACLSVSRLRLSRIACLKARHQSDASPSPAEE